MRMIIYSLSVFSHFAFILVKFLCVFGPRLIRDDTSETYVNSTVVIFIRTKHLKHSHKVLWMTKIFKIRLCYGVNNSFDGFLYLRIVAIEQYRREKKKKILPTRISTQSVYHKTTTRKILIWITRFLIAVGQCSFSSNRLE